MTAEGAPKTFLKIIGQAPEAGHDLMLLAALADRPGAPDVAVCVQCGAYAAQGGKPGTNLLTTCPRQYMHGTYRTRVRRAFEGRHPDKQRHGDEVYFDAS